MSIQLITELNYIESKFIPDVTCDADKEVITLSLSSTLQEFKCYIYNGNYDRMYHKFHATTFQEIKKILVMYWYRCKINLLKMRRNLLQLEVNLLLLNKINTH